MHLTRLRLPDGQPDLGLVAGAGYHKEPNKALEEAQANLAKAATAKGATRVYNVTFGASTARTGDGRSMTTVIASGVAA